MAILDTVKKALLIPLTETYADEELLSHIEAAKNSCVLLVWLMKS
jgi:hypothetical protein